MPIENEEQAIGAVVSVLNSNSADEKKLNEIFNYIYKEFMMKRGSGTKGFMNVCIMCTPSCLGLDKWMELWGKSKTSKTFKWCGSHAHKWDEIGLTQVNVAKGLTPKTDPPAFPEWVATAKQEILKNLIKVVGGQLKKGFPKRCLDRMAEK